VGPVLIPDPVRWKKAHIPLQGQRALPPPPRPAPLSEHCLLSVVKNKVSGVRFQVSAQPLVAEATGLNEKEITIKIKAEFKDVN
jgi:hypothetical protein